MPVLDPLRPNELQIAKQAEADRVLDQVVALCASVGPGGRLPRHTDLMLRFGASHRNVMRSLEELQRQGRIVRRHGSGTFVMDETRPARIDTWTHGMSVLPRTIVAIARPDKSIFDRGIELLYGAAEEAGLSLACHFLGAEGVESIDPAVFGKPLGFVLFRQDLAPLARQLFDSGHRVVLIGSPRVLQSFGVPTICGNQEHGGYLVTKYLVELGHRRIVYANVGGGMNLSPRWQGTLRMIREAERNGASIEYDLADNNTVHEWARDPDTLHRYLLRPDAPTAIVAWNDQEALGIMASLGRAGISVPDQVSVIGFDNLEEGRRANPALSTVDHLIDQQINTAVGLLTSPVAATANEKLIFAPTLIARETTAAR